MFGKKKAGRRSGFFVSIGAGINQIPLILEAKKLGFQVIGVDANTHAAGIIHCDLKIQDSAENYQEIYVKLREFLIDGEIACVLSKSYGPSIKTACYLAEKFNIPLLPLRRVDDFLNKESMKRVLIEGGVATPRYRLLSPGKNKNPVQDFHYPMIVKPAVGHAKKGVRLIQSEREMGAYLSDNRRALSILTEEYIEGDEIIAAGIVHGGAYHLVEISDKVLSRPPFFVDLAHISPSRHYSLRDQISSMGQKVAECFEIITSPLIMEIRITPEGKLFLIEAVPEFGGEFIPDILIPSRRGYNFIAETIKAAAGLDFKNPPADTGKNSIVVKYITGKKGVFLSFSPESAENMKGVIFTRIFKDIGSDIIPPETNHDRIGVVIARGSTRGEAVENADMAIEKLNIRIRSGS